jgi:choline dehydrogenase-like flavoprotein
MKTDYDYIIVGAGSSGCVLANRLSADPAVSVCLIEAGSHDNSLRIQTPAGTITLYKSKKYSWNFFSAPQKHLNGRSLHTPRGKALGGSSSMNSMIYIRGHASDYDRWAQAGCPGWDWNSVLPYFKKSENNRLGQDPRLHGTTGELNVEAARDPNPVSQLFVKAAQQVGLRRNDDFNGDQLEGCGIYNLTQKDARRLSSYRAFVAPVLDRPNLTVITDCSVQSLVIETRVAKGVRVESEGQRTILTARREVILSAGSLGSPSLLLASGIGPANDLTNAGIKVEHDLPGVGKNLQDHLDGLITVRSKSPLTLGFSLGSLPSILASPLRYLFGKKGWLTTNYVEAGGFARTPLAETLPDVQFHFVPGYRSHRGRLFEWGHGYAVHTCVLRPKSIGEIRLGRDGKPVIDFNFLSDPQDARVLIEGLKLARRILADQPFDGIRGTEMLPGKHVQTDEQLMTYVRDYAATVFHPVGTCKMGIDPMSVVGPDLKVHGVQGLRVVDASIMPTLISGNTNAPCIMIGEKAADMILNKNTQLCEQAWSGPHPDEAAGITQTSPAAETQSS